MRSYEIVTVYNANVGDAGLRTEAKKIKEAITANGGVNVIIENWGKREFSYRMNGERYGYYLNFTFSSDNHNMITEIQRLMTISDSVVRYQTHRADLRFKKFKPVNRKPSEFDTDSDDFLPGPSMN